MRSSGGFPEAHPGHVAGDDGAGGFVEVPADVVGVGARRREQGVEQDIDVAHGKAVVLPDEVERVVGRAFHFRRTGFRELLRVAAHHAEGIDQQGPAAELAPAPGGDAPEFAARVYDDGRAPESPGGGRQQVEGDGGALAGARRRHGDGGAFQGPADQPGVAAGAPLAEQDAPAPGQTAQESSVEQPGPSVEVGFGAPPPVVAPEVLEAVDRDLEPQHEGDRESRRRHRDRCQLVAAETGEPGGQDREGGRRAHGTDDLHPDRRGADRRCRAVEPETDPGALLLASGRHVGQQHQNENAAEDREAEAGGAQALQQIGRPGGAGGEQQDSNGDRQEAQGFQAPSI